MLLGWRSHRGFRRESVPPASRRSRNLPETVEGLDRPIAMLKNTRGRSTPTSRRASGLFILPLSGVRSGIAPLRAPVRAFPYSLPRPAALSGQWVRFPGRASTGTGCLWRPSARRAIQGRPVPVNRSRSGRQVPSPRPVMTATRCLCPSGQASPLAGVLPPTPYAATCGSYRNFWNPANKRPISSGLPRSATASAIEP